MDVWTACVTWSERILEAVDRIVGERVDRLERYRTWSMAPATAEALLKTLLALSIHAPVLDAAAQREAGTEALVQRLRLADIEAAATARPSHELLAGLPRLREEDQLHADALRVLVYDDASALHLARLSQMVRICLMTVAAALPSSDPVCADMG
ncbi:hypothetical protein F8144_30200 [Streptomyces triticiradicis]|uniref:Uncharacterized protein n=1 Tax=Streptomyces triticiradicis TaxID=2651189 RepID=A0A7J5DB56_9ACTN|nr:hypothetical protein F8144_30200 [Streptomyces triticiradicis]